MGMFNPVTRDSDGATIRLDKEEAEQADTTARAKRVILVDSSGTIIKATQIEENRLGSELSGADGAAGRTLTLTNTSESGNPVSVWVEEQLVSQSDFTPSHSSSSSTITFGGIQIFNGDAIKILYYI